MLYYEDSNNDMGIIKKKFKDDITTREFCLNKNGKLIYNASYR